MTATAFEYERPDSAARAMELLAAPGAMVLAGGQSLIPLLNRRLVTPKRLVDISRIAELRKIELDDEMLRIGAAVRLAAIEKSPALVHFPLLAEAIASTGSPAIRNRATLIGNLVRANAMSELTVACVALNAGVVIGRQGTTRVMPASEFFLNHHSSAVGGGEIVLRLDIPRPKASQAGSAFCEIAARAGAPPLVCVAVQLEADAKGFITAARVVAGGIAGKPVPCANTEAALIGQPAAGAATHIASETLTPSPELPHASYALDVLPVVIERALTRAAGAIAPVSAGK
jgi:CO/xanthine dehydrogenase FAD-binding subunit